MSSLYTGHIFFQLQTWTCDRDIPTERLRKSPKRNENNNMVIINALRSCSAIVTIANSARCIRSVPLWTGMVHKTYSRLGTKL